MIKRYLFCVLIFIICINGAYAQENWGGGTDDVPINIGFVFQYISSKYTPIKAENWRVPFIDPMTGLAVKPSLYSITSPPTSGFGLGFVSNLKLAENFDIRFCPGYVFSDHTLTYDYANPSDRVSKTVSYSILSFPIGIRVRSDRRRNFRAYFVTGIRYSWDLITESKVNDDISKPLVDKKVKNNRGILWYEAGIGLQFYFEFFKLSPEIKFSHSFNDVLRPESHPYSTPLEKLFVQDIQFSIYLE
ncbi:MAG: outer membrane beta-barrel protein [Sphingobacteriaceae bacterium]